MNYNMNKSVQSEGTGLDFMDVGIHENCKMVNLKKDTSPNGNKFIVFYFENQEGKTLSFTEWEPKRRDKDTDESFASKILNQLSRIKHIATKFVTEEEFEFESTNFETFGNNVVAYLPKAKYENKLVRLKIIYNWNNFTTLPPYLPFIETMDITAADSKLAISSIDKMVKETGDKVSTQANPFETKAANTDTLSKDGDKATDGLPF